MSSRDTNVTYNRSQPRAAPPPGENHRTWHQASHKEKLSTYHSEISRTAPSLASTVMERTWQEEPMDERGTQQSTRNPPTQLNTKHTKKNTETHMIPSHSSSSPHTPKMPHVCKTKKQKSLFPPRNVKKNAKTKRPYLPVHITASQETNPDHSHQIHPAHNKSKLPPPHHQNSRIITCTTYHTHATSGSTHATKARHQAVGRFQPNPAETPDQNAIITPDQSAARARTTSSHHHTTNHKERKKNKNVFIVVCCGAQNDGKVDTKPASKVAQKLRLLYGN